MVRVFLQHSTFGKHFNHFVYWNGVGGHLHYRVFAYPEIRLKDASPNPEKD